jgi:hypothetical protein
MGVLAAMKRGSNEHFLGKINDEQNKKRKRTEKNKKICDAPKTLLLRYIVHPKLWAQVWVAGSTDRILKKEKEKRYKGERELIAFELEKGKRV